MKKITPKKLLLRYLRKSRKAIHKASDNARSGDSNSALEVLRMLSREGMVLMKLGFIDVMEEGKRTKYIKRKTPLNGYLQRWVFTQFRRPEGHPFHNDPLVKLLDKKYKVDQTGLVDEVEGKAFEVEHFVTGSNLNPGETVFFLKTREWGTGIWSYGEELTRKDFSEKYGFDPITLLVYGYDDAEWDSIFIKEDPVKTRIKQMEEEILNKNK